MICWEHDRPLQGIPFISTDSNSDPGVAMAIDYQIFPEKQLIVSYYSGFITLDDIVNLRKRVFADPRFNPNLHSIDDLTGVTDVNLDFDRLRGLSTGSLIRQGIRRALVAKTDLQFGMARMYQTVSEWEGQNFFVFHDIADAMSWVQEAEKIVKL